MNELQIFSSEEFGKIRTVIIGNEPWFVGKDVAGILGYERPTKAVADRVDIEDRDVVPIQDSIGRMQNTPIINESGLYDLIFGSKLESAKRFKHWVTSEVLPAIRKNGFYDMSMSTEMKAVLMLDQKQLKMEKRLDKLEFDIPLYAAEADELSSHVKRKGVELMGGKTSEAYKDIEIRSKVYSDIYAQVKREFGLYDESGKPRSYKALKRKYLTEAHKVVDEYETPVYLTELISAANAQMTMFSVEE